MIPLPAISAPALPPGVTASDIVWRPNGGAQVAFLACPVFEVLLHGNRGGGKTDALVVDYGKEVGKGYGSSWRGILFRHTYKQLADVIDKTQQIFPRVWPMAKYNASEAYWRWPGGETLFLRYLERESDYDNYHGHAYPWIGWEELTTWPTAVGYLRMMSTCRSKHREVPRRVRSTTNPYGPGHNWVKARFRLPAWNSRVIRDAADDKGNIEPERVAIFCPLAQNRVLLDADPGYTSRVRAAARNEAERKAWEEGSWDIVAGGMFDDVWNPGVHVIEPFTVPASWGIDRSFDWGSSKPFSVGWWAESDGTCAWRTDGSTLLTVRGDLFRIAEWYGCPPNKPNEGLRLTATEIAAGIIQRERMLGIEGRVQPGPADSSIFDFTSGHGIAEEMARLIKLPDGQMVKGPEWQPADKRPGSRKTGWDVMRRLFKGAMPPPNGHPRETPGFFVFRTCGEFQRTVPVLPRDERDMDDVDTESEDHIADEARYRALQCVRERPSSQPVMTGDFRSVPGFGDYETGWMS